MRRLRDPNPRSIEPGDYDLAPELASRGLPPQAFCM